MARFECFDIVWDTDGEEVDLPQTAVVECDNVEDTADALSDKFGWFVKSFSVHEFKKHKKVSFGMFWQTYGRQTIDLPDDIDEKDEEAVREYIRSVWDDIPLPDGEYVSGSDEMDEESMLDIWEE